MKTYGIDANALTREKRTGVERYVFSLLTHMLQQPLEREERVLLYCSAPIKDLSDLPQGWSQQVLGWPPKKAWTHGRLSWELFRRTPNVFFTPAHEVPFVHGNKKIVSTVHDVAFRVAEGVYPKKQVRRQEWAVKRAIRVSDHLLTVSETTKEDLGRLYHVPEEKLTATPLSIDAEQFSVLPERVSAALHKYRLARQRYFIYIGRLEHKKNIVRLVDAFTDFKTRQGIGDPTELVLGGSFGYGEEAIKERIRYSPARGSIKILGYVPDADLAPLLAGSLAHVFPSVYEGFGIPALEAQAAGTLTLCADIPALREVAGEGALFASPDSVSAWSQLFIRVVSGRIDRTRMLELGKKNLERFSWSRCAAQTWNALRSV